MGGKLRKMLDDVERRSQSVEPAGHARESAIARLGQLEQHHTQTKGHAIALGMLTRGPIEVESKTATSTADTRDTKASE